METNTVHRAHTPDTALPYKRHRTREREAIFRGAVLSPARALGYHARFATPFVSRVPPRAKKARHPSRHPRGRALLHVAEGFHAPHRRRSRFEQLLLRSVLLLRQLFPQRKRRQQFFSRDRFCIT